MFNSEPDAQAAFLTDASGNITTWNDGCETMFGIKREQALGESLGGLLAGPAQNAWPAFWASVGRQGRASARDLELRRADGAVFPARLALAPQYGGDGALRAWTVVVTAGDVNASEAERVGSMPLSALVDMFPGTFYALNRERRFVLWNRNLERAAEMAPDEVAASSVLEMFDLPERPFIAEQIRRVFDEGAEVKIEANFTPRSGRDVPILLCGTRITCGGQDYLFGLGLDISERRAQEQQLRLRERALHAASNGIVITRCEGRDSPIEYVNPAFERITGYSAEEVLGRDSRFMAAPGLDANERAQVRNAVAERRAVNVVFRNLRKNGDLFWNDLSITPVRDEHGTVTHFIGVIVDVTAAKQRTAYLEHEVNHDGLTGLANRNLLWDRLEQALHMAQRHKSLVATVLVDLNNFKAINDSFGHEAGDLVLKVVAKRLQASVRDSDTVARLSGDEFVVVLVNQPSLRFTARMVERVRHALGMPVAFARKEIPVGASVGVALYPHDGATVADLVRSADVAMYHAKASGGNQVYFFSADMKATTEAKQRLESGLREALERDELFLLFQPLMDMRSGKIKGFEALLRWRRPEHGVVLPADFLAEAEESGSIVEIGSRVMDQACAFLQQLREQGHPDLPVSVNVSQRELSQHDFVAGVAARLARNGLQPASLEIEVREDALIRNPGLGRDIAGQLRELGLPLSVDEFGRGISDLGFLQELTVRQLKLAKAAVHGIANGGPGSRIAKTLIDIGHNLDMAVIGEAVETRAQMEFLKNHGCDQLQGSWFSEPLAAEAAQQMLRERQFA
jgi:diguanylate cyclase (GGDEF)-like protein/PAS domain S-box-containing protein